MCRQIPGWKLQEWKYFLELDPSADYRADWNAAHIVQAIMRDGKQLQEFRLPFGDTPKIVAVTQTVEFQEQLLDGWIAGHNLALEAKGKHQ